MPAAADDPVTVPMPDSSPAKDASGLRQSIQAFLNAVILEGGPQADLARSLTVRQPKDAPRTVIVGPKSGGVYASAIAAALGGDPALAAEQALLSSLPSTKD